MKNIHILTIVLNLFKDNIALCVGRQGGTVGAMSWNVVFISESMVDLNLFYRGGEQVFPLYIIHEDGGKTPNFSPRELSSLTANLLSEPSPDELLNYIYAVLHSPSYRTENNEFLRIDYPRIPIPTQAEFDRLVPLGRELRELHLMKSSVIDDYDTTFSETGECMVEKIVFSDEKVWINKTQYFGNVPEIAWNFYIGGYQPAQKWLKDRKGRKLSDNDLVHYQRIIKILLETDRIMKLIG
jgi:predicted helicase